MQELDWCKLFSFAITVGNPSLSYTVDEWTFFRVLKRYPLEF